MRTEIPLCFVSPPVLLLVRWVFAKSTAIKLEWSSLCFPTKDQLLALLSVKQFVMYH